MFGKYLLLTLGLWKCVKHFVSSESAPGVRDHQHYLGISTSYARGHLTKLTTTALFFFGYPLPPLAGSLLAGVRKSSPTSNWWVTALLLAIERVWSRTDIRFLAGLPGPSDVYHQKGNIHLGTLRALLRMCGPRARLRIEPMTGRGGNFSQGPCFGIYVAIPGEHC